MVANRLHRAVAERRAECLDKCGVVERAVVEGAGHGDVIDLTRDQVTAWMEARLAGEEPVDSCEEGGA